MEKEKDINRIKVVLVEKKRTNKWLAEQLGKDPATVSKWCTNTSQPGLETLLEIARVLDVDIKELLNSTRDDVQLVRIPKTVKPSNVMNSNDRANLIKRINTLEGLTDKERSALLGLLRENKTYGLVWEDKPEDVEERLRDELPILTEVPERAIISEDKDAPNHILIEGDNLEALATLAYTHEGKIDIIYIDPPYNTGNNDFIYNDSYVDKEDSYRHSKWLSFMSRRLRIAKKLLSDYGVIFISIDDNEQADLKILCDSIFMPSNFCGQFIWRKKSGGGQTDRYFVTEHEYILVYQATNKFCWKDIQIEKSRKNYKYQDEKGSYNLIKLEKWGSSAHKEDRPSMYFPIKNPDGEDFYPVAPDGKAGRWRVGVKKMQTLIKDNLIEWKNGIPYEKDYYSETEVKTKTQKVEVSYIMLEKLEMAVIY